jgi:glycosyltransferase involved in cell wall biosynthesis
LSGTAITTGAPDLKLLDWLRPSLGRLGTHQPRSLHLPDYSRHRLSSLNTPRISVVVPSFRQARFIRETLVSLLDEGYPDLELIVIDGGSDDGTVEILREFDSRITWWVSEPDRGQTHAINKGFARSTGDIMAWLNSDDRIVPGCLHLIAWFFQQHPTADVVYGNRILINEEGLEIGRWILPPHSDHALRWVDFVPQETLYWRRRAWQATGASLDESFQFAMDWDLLLRFSKAGLQFRHLPKFLGLFRIHSNQKTSKEMVSTGSKEMARLRKQELGFLPTRLQMLLNAGPYMLSAKFVETAGRLRSYFSGSA